MIELTIDHKSGNYTITQKVKTVQGIYHRQITLTQKECDTLVELLKDRKL